MDRCGHCRAPLPEDATTRRQYCDTAHRVAAFKARQRRQAEEYRALLAATVHAVNTGDVDAIQTVTEQAARILEAS